MKINAKAIYLAFTILCLACNTEVKHANEVQAEPSDEPQWYESIQVEGIHKLNIGQSSQESNGWHLKNLNKAKGASSDIIQSAEQEFYVSSGLIRKINLRYSLKDSLNSKAYFNQLIEHLNSLYHPAKDAGVYATWKTSSTSGTLVEVELLNDIELFGTLSFSLNWEEIEGRLYED